MQQNLYDSKGRRAGYTYEMTSIVYGYDSKGRKVGWHCMNSNATYDSKGQRVGSGNLVTALIMEAHNNSI